MSLGQGRVKSLGHGQQLFEVLARSKTDIKRFDRERALYMCVLGQGLKVTAHFGSRQTTVCYTVHI